MTDPKNRSESQPVWRVEENLTDNKLTTRARLGTDNAGWARQENTGVMPAATEMAGVDMRLEPGGYRELHWHVAAEWSLVLNGSCRIQVSEVFPYTLLILVEKLSNYLDLIGSQHGWTDLCGWSFCRWYLVFPAVCRYILVNGSNRIGAWTSTKNFL